MISLANLEADRRNSQEHGGLRASKEMNQPRSGGASDAMRFGPVVLPGEDLQAFQRRLERWSEAAQPRNAIEEFLVYRVVGLSWKLERVERAYGEHISSRIKSAPDRGLEEVERLGRRLLSDRRGPIALYGIYPLSGDGPRTSWSAQVDDPDEPSVLVKRLESTRAGCRWLLAHWAGLRNRLKSPGFWQSHDRLTAIRLLGRQPVDAALYHRVALIYVCSDILSPEARPAFADLRSDMLTSDLKVYMTRLRLRWPDLVEVSGARKARRMLVDLVDHAIERLNMKVQMHVELAQEYADRNADRSGLDQGPEAERLRRCELACTRAFYWGLHALNEQRRADTELAGGNRRQATQESGRRTEDDAIERFIARDGTCELDLSDPMFDADGDKENPTPQTS